VHEQKSKNGCFKIGCLFFLIFAAGCAVLSLILKSLPPGVLHDFSTSSWGGGMDVSGYRVKEFDPSRLKRYLGQSKKKTEFPKPIGSNGKRWIHSNWQETPVVNEYEKIVNSTLSAMSKDTSAHLDDCTTALNQSGNLYKFSAKFSTGNALSSVKLEVVDFIYGRHYDFFSSF